MGHNQLADLLLEREVIFAEDVEKIFGKRPWVSRSEEIMESENGNNANKETPAINESDNKPSVSTGDGDNAGINTGDEKI